MIMIFNRKEVYCGFSMEECSEIRDTLSVNQIKYIYKCISNKGSAYFSSNRSVMGSLGEDVKYAYLYYVYVHKDDYELASHVINQNKKNL